MKNTYKLLSALVLFGSLSVSAHPLTGVAAGTKDAALRASTYVANAANTVATSTVDAAKSAGHATASAFTALKANVAALPAKTQQAFNTAVTVATNNPKTSVAIAATVAALSGYLLYTKYNSAPAADGSDVA